MSRMKRKDVLKAIRIAGYHGDLERATLLYVKNWVSLEAFGREFDAGVAMRQSRIPCDCFECGKADRDAALPGDWPARKAQPSGKGKTMAMAGALQRAAVRVAMRKAPSLRG